MTDIVPNSWIVAIEDAAPSDDLIKKGEVRYCEVVVPLEGTTALSNGNTQCDIHEGSDTLCMFFLKLSNDTRKGDRFLARCARSFEPIRRTEDSVKGKIKETIDA